MSSYVGDSELFCDQFSTPEMRTIFDDRNTVQKWLDTGVALAQAEADLGLIPQEAAIQISEAGRQVILLCHSFVQWRASALKK